MNPVGRGDLELIGGIDLGGELPGLLGGALEPEGLVAIPSAPSAAGITGAAGGLGGEGTFEGVGVELEDDDALGGSALGVDDDDAGADGLGYVCVTGYGLVPF